MSIDDVDWDTALAWVREQPVPAVFVNNGEEVEVPLDDWLARSWRPGCVNRWSGSVGHGMLGQRLSR